MCLQLQEDHLLRLAQKQVAVSRRWAMGPSSWPRGGVVLVWSHVLARFGERGVPRICYWIRA